MRPLLEHALREDLGIAGDLTTDAIVAPEAMATASLRSRRPGRIAGLLVAAETFRLLDPQAELAVSHADGTDVPGGAELARVRGRARALLSAERSALNLLCRLSGIATATRDLVRAIGRTPPSVVCTRKTTPGLRALEKYAVRVGGGANHRFGLHDAVLIKDNHRAVAGSLREAVERVRSSVGHLVKIEIEVDTLAQVEQALELGVEALLLDNMGLHELARAVSMCRGRALTEASGGITPETAPEVAATGVDLLSVGWLTHSAPALDVGLDFEPDE